MPRNNEEKYLDLKTLSGRTSISVRKYRDCIKDPCHPLPYYKLDGKILIRWSDFENWISKYKVIGGIDIDGIVNDVLNDRL